MQHELETLSLSLSEYFAVMPCPVLHLELYRWGQPLVLPLNKCLAAVFCRDPV